MADDKVPNYTIRQMKREEIPAVLDLWRETKLAEGTYSVHTFYEYDPDGFFVAVTDDGTIIGSCAGVKQNDDVYFIGLYAVRSGFRGRGIGLRVWNAVTAHIGDHRNVGVNPVPEQLANYRDRSGLPTQTAWVTYLVTASSPDLSLFGTNGDVDLKTLEIEDEDLLERVREYDEGVYGYSRGRLVRLSCTQPESLTVVAERSGVVCGYGNIKKNINAPVIVGPLYADDVAIAEAILCKLVTDFPGAEERGVIIMVIDVNQEAVEMVKRLGFTFSEATGRLYRKEEVHVEYRKVFGQHNLNFSLF